MKKNPTRSNLQNCKFFPDFYFLYEYEEPEDDSSPIVFLTQDGLTLSFEAFGLKTRRNTSLFPTFLVVVYYFFFRGLFSDLMDPVDLVDLVDLGV